MIDALTLERRIIIISVAFVLVLFGLAALAINLFHVGLPTCLTDIKPFQKGELITHSPTHYEVHYVARMWEFDPEEVVVPAGSTIDIYVSTPDVTHGLILLGTNLNLMAVPGVVNYTRVKFDQPHTYQLLCHEYCGTGHERMAAKLRVVDAATFQTKKVTPAPPQQTNPTYQLLEAKDCMTCHSIDGSEGIGPTLKGVYGRKTKLTNGSTITADDVYLRDSIVNPSATVVAGFDDVMPKPELTDEEVKAIVEYLENLK
ncbi:MAG TPA: c-type cytochrome [Chthoniobacterales bacterium]|nr:c-type cytochrome [Chthoniobacterales bacterium]